MLRVVSSPVPRMASLAGWSGNSRSAAEVVSASLAKAPSRRRWPRDRSRSRLFHQGSAVMPDEFVYLAQVDLHIAGAKERIDKQQQLIERLCASGHSARDAENFLFALTGLLSAFQRHRLLILNRL